VLEGSRPAHAARQDMMAGVPSDAGISLRGVSQAAERGSGHGKKLEAPRVAGNLPCAGLSLESRDKFDVGGP